ncbi:auxin-responsive protein SAUR72-like [Nymphaea colorata]|uniref:auxin-responsive protein SAUR72-like n=1 Tax=Nymphaea colorata TaxID=210225 RepID=UPI00129EF46D|nr:auxin-responsive protein SAUR72-like [Nymphaea colorata]
MKQLMRKLSRVADSSSPSYAVLHHSDSVPASKRKGWRLSSSSSFSSSAASKGVASSPATCKVPEGHLPVCVGEEMERFVVSAESLNHPLFAELLRRSAQEYGYDQKGVLRIPCPAGIFRSILQILRRKDGDADGAGVDLDELLRRLASADASL